MFKASETEDVDGAPVAWEGFTMEDAKIHASLQEAQMKAKTPTDVLQELQRGNARFWAGKATRPEVSAFERRALIMQHYPSVAILGCSDSRVPIEIVFDQGLGDIFVIRVAGNCLDTTTTASLQYAVKHLSVQLVVVMGHEGCGAVKAAQSSPDDINKESPHLRGLLRSIKNDLDGDRLFHIRDSRARDREAVVTNVKKQVEKLRDDEVVMKAVFNKARMTVPPSLLVCYGGAPDV